MHSGEVVRPNNFPLVNWLFSKLKDKSTNNNKFSRVVIEEMKRYKTEEQISRMCLVEEKNREWKYAQFGYAC